MLLVSSCKTPGGIGGERGLKIVVKWLDGGEAGRRGLRMKAGTRKPVPPWRELRRYYRPCSDCPMLDAHIWFNPHDDGVFFVVTSDLGIFGAFPAVHPVHWTMTHAEEDILVAKFIRKAVAQEERRQVNKSAAAVQWEATHPALWEYLTVETHDNGQPRETSMLCVFCEEGLVKMALQDRDQGRSLWVTSQSFYEALAALESRLASGEGDWRPMRSQVKKGAYRKS
jgi:hypothetical protein